MRGAGLRDRLTFASRDSISAPDVCRVSAAVVFHRSTAETPLMVPPVSASVVGAMRASSCFDRVAATTALNRPFMSPGRFRAYSAFALKKSLSG